MKRDLKFDLKTLLTLSFTLSVIILTFMWTIKPEVAIIPAFLTVMSFFFAKKVDNSTSNSTNV